MLSENKIRKMIRLSDYETGLGSADLKRTSYKKRDYIHLQYIKTSVAVLVAWGFIFLFMCLNSMEYILIHLFEIPFRELAILVGSGFVLFEIFSLFATKRIAEKNYDESLLRVKEYEKTLQELHALYEEERGQEETVL